MICDEDIASIIDIINIGDVGPLFQYRGYGCKFGYCAEDGVWYGILTETNDLVTFTVEDPTMFESVFQSTVDKHILMLEQS